MNNERRKELAGLSKQLKDLITPEVTKAIELLSNLKAGVDVVKEDLERIRDEEQEYIDNMPESLQQGERADAAQNAITEMESALEELDSLIELVEPLENLTTIDDTISNVDGFIDNAAQ